MALQDYQIRPIECRLAQEVVVREHYLHRKAPCHTAFGLYLEDELKGVVMYGSPASRPLTRGVAGDAHVLDVAELTRLWISDDVPKNGESFLIGRTLPLVPKKFIVSFAEPAEGHVGVVYQATNWFYTGLSAKRTNWEVDGFDAKHNRTLTAQYGSAQLKELYGDKFRLVPRPRKHRYVFINAKGREKARLLKELRYPVLPYPKKGVDTD